MQHSLKTGSDSANLDVKLWWRYKLGGAGLFGESQRLE